MTARSPWPTRSRPASTIRASAPSTPTTARRGASSSSPSPTRKRWRASRRSRSWKASCRRSSRRTRWPTPCGWPRRCRAPRPSWSASRAAATRTCTSWPRRWGRRSSEPPGHDLRAAARARRARADAVLHGRRSLAGRDPAAGDRSRARRRRRDRARRAVLRPDRRRPGHPARRHPRAGCRRLAVPRAGGGGGPARRRREAADRADGVLQPRAGVRPQELRAHGHRRRRGRRHRARPAVRGMRSPAGGGRAGRARPRPVRRADLAARAREGHRAAGPRLHLRGLGDRYHRRAEDAAARAGRPDPHAAAGHHPARVRRLRRLHARAGRRRRQAGRRRARRLRYRAPRRAPHRRYWSGGRGGEVHRRLESPAAGRRLSVAWFTRKPHETEGTPKKVVIAEGLWIKCESCKEIVYRAEVERAGRVCPKCRYPFRISARERIGLLTDAGSFEEHQASLSSVDPLNFKDTKRYRDRLKAAKQKTSAEDAVLTGLARIGGYPAVLCVFEFGFLGGSMGSVVGEKLTRGIELAIDKHVPVIIVAASGGARMQEGILSLMQMAKTSAALERLGRARLPYLSVLTDPTTGGVTASFAMLGDVILAEPRALIGFAGPRVIAETIRQPLPDGFQRSEFLLEHGQLDLIVERKELKDTLRRLLAFFADQPTPPA